MQIIFGVFNDVYGNVFLESNSFLNTQDFWKMNFKQNQEAKMQRRSKIKP